MALNDSSEVELLRDIRELLRPIAHHYQGEFDEWEAQMRRKLTAEVKAAVEVSPTRRKAWELADGSRTQREISREARLNEGATSRFFKQLRAFGAVEGDQPKRVMEV